MSAHELRTPLAALRTYTELQRDGGVDEETRAEFLDRSTEQLTRLEWMSANLLDLSRIDAGIFPMDVKIGDLREPVRVAVEATAESGRGSPDQRDLRRAVDDGGPPIRPRADRPAHHQPGRQRREVHRPRRDGGARGPRRAGGRGDRDRRYRPRHPPAELPRIFDRFYRGTNVGEARASGSGLGLAIARSIVEMHGGFIEVASVLGEGTVFRVVLPRQGAAAAGELANVEVGAPPA